MLEPLFNKVAGLQALKRLQHRCFTLNIAKFLRTLILKNICKRLLLKIRDTVSFHVISNNKRIKTKARFESSYLKLLLKGLIKNWFIKEGRKKTCLVNLLNNIVWVPSDQWKSWYQGGNTNQSLNNLHFGRSQRVQFEWGTINFSLKLDEWL